ncbi:Rieske 2Fe-2S domain-containing protein [Limnohabitans sp. Hippo4]|uniref:Rieske 2Fe-2S domain-containing protein n=1 Tax=Limnohabitans sp. Hippo4 TaxID=1826167 RepID=UPI000D3BFB34|nr:Rieske 2Fe-2S domain-containing protein [Limnohabitans sp. Hippo4]PUE36770.1 phthalate 4,5-dioxygenase [Limnohabitans sp. Hippo4]
MAFTREQNDLLTRVENDAPMGQMLRQYHWFPCVPARLLEADGKPYNIRLLGQDFVAFRSTDGSVGVVDAKCLHRKASLALAKNDGNGLRCIFHGWKYNTKGEVIDAPNHPGDSESFCKNLRVNKYLAVERGGIVWAWFGKGDTPPKFPELPFTALPDNQRSVTSVEVPTNWVQAVEASMDTSHVSVLHESTTEISAGAGNLRQLMSKNAAATLEFIETPYGFRYAALRKVGDGKTYARVNNFVMPWYGIICAPHEQGPATVFFSTPIDDVTHRAWFVHYNMHRPLGMTNMSASPDIWNFPPLPPGNESNNWGQNRDLMRRGHATGFPQHLGTEDFAMFLSQGPIHDRTDEQLCPADGALIRVRRQLMRAAQEYVTNKAPIAPNHEQLDYKQIQSIGAVLEADQNWREL